MSILEQFKNTHAGSLLFKQVAIITFKAKEIVVFTSTQVISLYIRTYEDNRFFLGDL